MLYNKEQLLELIGTIKDNIAMSEMLLANNPKMANAADVKKVLEQQKKSLERYTDQLNNLNQVGRPPIGITKKVSMTLSEDEWELFDEQANGNRSKFLREIVGKILEGKSEEAVSVKPTFISCCAECKKDFREGETCHFTWYENNVFCHECKGIMNGRVTESYLDWQLRIYTK